MNALQLTLASTIINAITTLLVGGSVFLVWKQIKGTYEWNRRKTSQEVLMNLVIGEFPNLKDKLVQEFGADYIDPTKTYKILHGKLDEAQGIILESLALRQLNILEAIGINIKSNIIDEDICYNYLGRIMVVVRQWADALIQDRRGCAGDDVRVFGHVTLFADRWAARIEREK